MANVDAAFGLRPYKLAGGGHQATRYRIQTAAQAGTSSALYSGQLVIADTNGIIAPAAAATGGTVAHVGVFWGVEYVNLSGTPTFTNTWPGTASAKTSSVAWGFVYDDPDLLFLINCDAAAADTAIFANAQTATGLTGSNGISLGELAVSSVATTSTHPLRIRGFDDSAGNDDATVAGRLAIVSLNNHSYRQATGT